MSGMDGMNGMGLVGMAVEEMVALAERLFGDAQRHYYAHGFFGDGVMVVTDTKIMLRVWDERIRQPEQEGRKVPGCDKLERTPLMAGGHDWAFGALAKAAAEQYPIGEKRFEDAMDKFERENRWKTTKCPCCGEELVVEDDEVQSFDEYMQYNGPSRTALVGKVFVREQREGWRVCLNAGYVLKILEWARKAGGLKGLFVSDKPDDFTPVRFVGEKWEVVLMPIRDADAAQAAEVALPMVPAVRVKKVHSPFPWKVRDEIGDYIIEDANGKPVANPCGRDSDVRLVNAEFIVEAMNKHDKLRELLKRSLEFVAEWVAECEDQYKMWKGRESAGKACRLKADIDEGNAIFAEAPSVLGDEMSGLQEGAEG